MSAEDPIGTGSEDETALLLTDQDIGRAFLLTESCLVLEVSKGTKKSRRDRVKLLGLGHMSPQHEITKPQYVSLEPGEYTFAGHATYGPNSIEEWGLVFTVKSNRWRNAERYYLFPAKSLELQNFRRVNQE